MMANRKVFIILFILILILTGKDVFSAPPLESLVPKKDIPREWSLIQGPQTYTKKTLFEHINGQADLFFKYGFQKSVFAIYQSRRGREDQIEVDIYDMGNVLQAFGIFSRFRNEDRPGGFGLDSYLDDQSAFFYKGRYFVMFYATESNRDFLRQFCKLISSKISDPSPPPKEIGYFPGDGLKPGSIQYFSEGLLGRQFLKRGFLGTYAEKAEAEDKDKTLKLFLAVFQNSQKASDALRDFRDDLSKKGKISSESIIEFETRVLNGEDPYQGKVMVAQKKFYLLGVVGFEKEEGGENRLAEFMKKVN
jgi:hypothetical protein